MKLRDFVGVAGRYQKSVNLERDAAADEALAGYIVTPLVRTVLRRLALGLRPDAVQRAWSITGPYGTGKSSLALLWSNLIGPREAVSARKAHQLLSASDKELSRLFSGARSLVSEGRYVTALATGERAPLNEVILRAVHRALDSFWSGRGAKPAVLRSVSAAVKAAERGKAISARCTVELIEAAAKKICESSNAGAGLAIVLDEAGKCLEYATHNPSAGDVQLLQELAEAANRSGEAPILFVTIFHQGIERYANRLGAAQRNEWAKVQGRFEDIAFQEESDQLLRLIAAALVVRKKLPVGIGRDYRRLAKKVAMVASGTDPQRASELESQLLELFPLHPVCGLLLGPLFRTGLAQNERSLFSFLTSGEPLGFQAHLGSELSKRTADNLFRADHLYDYVVTALGTKLYGQNGRAWAEVDTALRRLPRDAEACDARTLKAIGLLTLVGDHAGLRASPELLQLALSDNGTSAKSVTKSLARLSTGSAIVFRKYRNAFQIWEGSDLNIDDLVRDAFGHTDTRAGLARRLTVVAPPRPIVARRHLFQTGTLRYFDVQYVDAQGLELCQDHAPGADADGQILVALPRTPSDLASLRELVGKQMFWFANLGENSKPVIVGIPRNANHLADLAAELAALEWVQSNTAELATDPVARRELSARLSEAERLARDELIRLLDGGQSDGCDWFYRGEMIDVTSSPDLGRRLSDICDHVYDAAPIIQNELLNRRQLSSAAAAARRNLLEAMIEHGDRERLGLEGYPPEVSMYRSVIEQHRIHRKTKGHWRLTAPTSRGEGSMRAVWKAIDAFLSSTEENRRSIADLYEILRRPPFGLKDGVLPILTCAAVLHLDAEVALYENGAFVPGLTTPVAERLLRWPEKFELQRFKIAGVRARVFERFGRALLSGFEADKPTLLAIVRNLVSFIAELPLYARSTKRVSPVAQEVRRVLRAAQEPGPLLFNHLPEACGCKPFGTNSSAKSAYVEKFFTTLRGCLGELQVAYAELLTEIRVSLATTFDLPAEADELRSELRRRSRRVLPIAGDPQTKAFLLRAADDALPYEEWLISLATHLARKPPPKWHDSDLEAMQVALAGISRQFRALESLAIQLGDGGDEDDLLRLSILAPGYAEQDRVIALRAHEQPVTTALHLELSGAVKAHMDNRGVSVDAAIAALVHAVQDLLREEHTADGAHKYDA